MSKETFHSQTLPPKHILDNLVTSVLVVTPKLNLAYLNPAAEELFSVSARRVVGQPLTWLLAAGDDLLTSLNQALIQWHPITERELSLVLHNQNSLKADCRVMPVAHPIIGDYLLVEITQVDRQLRITREETLLSQQHATQALLRGLAHEVKNPLGGIRGAAQLLSKQLDSFELNEYIQVIIDEADRLRNLVDRMLLPNTLPRKAQTNIHFILERVYALASAENKNGPTIKRDYDPSLPDLLADPDQLIQAVLNVVRNAVQALAGNGEITLRTRSQRRFTIGNTMHRLVLQIDIIDNGPGIDPAIKQNIFFPLISGRAEGTGLGLSIAQSLINQHNGLIECESEPGHTCFSIFLPVTTEPNDHDQ